MGRSFLALPSEKARKLGKKPTMVSQPELEQNGHKFTIVDGCMLKMVTQKQLKVPHAERNESDEKRETNGIIVAAFDMDQTLVTTKSGLKLGRNGYDWKFLPDVKSHLKRRLSELRSENPDHKVVVVIFTNQNGCLPKFSGKSLQYVRTKLVGIVDSLPVFDYAFANMKAPTPELKATYRKPARGMFDNLVKELRSKFGKPVDMEKSFYVGDGSGRPGDHSADDLQFAENAGVRFYTPEDYFK